MFFTDDTYIDELPNLNIYLKHLKPYGISISYKTIYFYTNTFDTSELVRTLTKTLLQNKNQLNAY